MSKPLLYNSGLQYNTRGLVYGGSLPDSPTINKRKTVSLTSTEVFGFADKVDEAMDSNTTELAAAGLTVATLKGGGTTLKDDAVHQEDLEGKAKAALVTQTQATQAALQAVYDYYSSKLDVVVGVFGKTSVKGKQLLRIRSDIRRGPNSPQTPPAAAKS